MNIISGKNRRAVGESTTTLTRIKEMPRCLCPAGIAVYSIPLSKIQSPKNAKRSSYPPESIAALAQSIHKYGVIQPLTVKTAAGGWYELVCGERRLRAVRLLGHTSVNCIVISSDNQKSDAMMLCEDVIREELHYLDIACAIGRLCEKYRLDATEAAAKLCLSDRYVSDKLRLLEWPEEQRKTIRESALTQRQALSLLSVEDAEVRSRLLREVTARRLDERTTDELVFSCLKKRLRHPFGQNSTALIRDVRIFYNTIERALDVMRHAGYAISAEKKEGEHSTSILITVPKEPT